MSNKGTIDFKEQSIDLNKLHEYLFKYIYININDVGRRFKVFGFCTEINIILNNETTNSSYFKLRMPHLDEEEKIPFYKIASVEIAKIKT